MTQIFLFRLGDGNDGNFPRFVVELKDDECPYAALRALVANAYCIGHRLRRHVIKHAALDGEVKHGIQATVMEGPDGETAFDAAYITAELEPLDAEDAEHYTRKRGKLTGSLRSFLDKAAWRMFQKDNRKSKEWEKA